MASFWLQAAGGAVGNPGVRVRFYGRRADDPLPPMALFTSEPGFSGAWQWVGLEDSVLYEVYPTVVGAEWESQPGPTQQAVAVPEQEVILSEWTDVVVFTTFQEAGVPPTPLNLIATALTHQSIHITWDAVPIEFDASYRLQFALAPFDPGDGIPLFDGSQIFRVHTGLIPETEYYYRVMSYNAIGESDWSELASATTKALPVPAMAFGTYQSQGRREDLHPNWPYDRRRRP